MTNELNRYYSDLRDKNRAVHEKRVALCDQKSPRFRSLADERGLVLPP